METYVLQGKQKTHFARDRGSKYRGVTQNGGKWQVLFTIDQEYIYLCCSSKERYAASLYDISMIQAKGMKAITNFNYSKAHLLAILYEKSIVAMRKDHV